MISWDDHRPMRQFCEPVVEVDDRVEAFGEVGEIAWADEDVSVRNFNLAMEFDEWRLDFRTTLGNPSKAAGFPLYPQLLLLLLITHDNYVSGNIPI